MTRLPVRVWKVTWVHGDADGYDYAGEQFFDTEEHARRFFASKRMQRWGEGGGRRVLVLSWCDAWAAEDGEGSLQLGGRAWTIVEDVELAAVEARLEFA